MQVEAINVTDSLVLTLLTLVLYQSVAWAQQKWQLIWLNPMLFTIFILIPYLLFNDINHATYRQSTQFLNVLLEVATVALGYPLYLQLRHIKRNWQQLVALLALGVIIVITLSFLNHATSSPERNCHCIITKISNYSYWHYFNRATKR